MVDSTRHTFQASGSLWRDALVMQDMETGSLWSQVSGECISGKLEGKQLNQFAAMHTTFDEFKKLYPNGMLLKKPEKFPEGSPYKSYFDDPDKIGIFGRVNDLTELGAKSKIYGLRLNEGQIAVAEDYLVRNGYALIPTASPPAMIVFSAKTGTVAAFTAPQGGAIDLEKAKIDGRKIIIPNTNFAWHTYTGESVSLEVGDLEMVSVITAYWFAWKGFFPETERIK